VTVVGQVLEWGELDVDRCTAVYQAGAPEYSPFLPEHVAEFMRQLLALPPGPERQAMISSVGDLWSFLRRELPYCRAGWESYHHPSAICGARGCMRACMIHLEEQGKLENRFASSFRRRPPWRLLD
jgi:hypothetical protein